MTVLTGLPEPARMTTAFETSEFSPPNVPDRPEVRRSVFHLPTQEYQFFSKYAQWREQDHRRETWPEGVDRVIGYFQDEIGAWHLTSDEWECLRKALLNLDATCAMRVLQMAGPALKRCNVGAYNCTGLPISDLRCFAELLYVLMQGSGAGFSVERTFVDQLPVILFQDPRAQPWKIVIPDSTEGWCDALHEGLKAWYGGHDVVFDYSRIRPSGTRLKTKGGTASGPGPLKHLLDFARSKVLSRQGEKLHPLDVHDICCMVGQIVQVGGVRRAAEISLFDPDDAEMLRCKDWPGLNSERQRFMANNSVVFNDKPTPEAFWDYWNVVSRSGTGEPGFFNRYAARKVMPERRDLSHWFITNPCCEILFRPFGMCNLSIAVARSWDTRETLRRKVRAAALFGTLQSCLTRFNYIRPEWARNCEEERLLGVDITGQMDCPLLRPNNPGREALLDELQAVARATNEEFAARLGIASSVALTCVKPSGNSSQFFGCSAGIHGWPYLHMIRRFRAGRREAVTRMLMDQGVPWQPVVGPGETAEDSAVVCFEFPVKAPEGAFTTEHMDEIETLENWLIWKTHWAEHSVSQTVYVSEDKWDAVGQWVFDHWDQVTGLSFFPKTDHKYDLAPIQEVTEEEYNALAAVFPRIDYSDLPLYEREDTTTSAQEIACFAGSCELV